MAVDDDLTCKEACCVDVREALEDAKNDAVPVNLITAGETNANNPNTSGEVIEVREGVVILALEGQPGRIGIFPFCQIIGVLRNVPIVP